MRMLFLEAFLLATKKKKKNKLDQKSLFHHTGNLLMWVFFSLIITVHLFSMWAVPNFAAPLYQVTQTRLIALVIFLYLLRCIKLPYGEYTICKPYVQFLVVQVLCLHLLAFPFCWNSGRGKERRWRLQLRFKVI